MKKGLMALVLVALVASLAAPVFAQDEVSVTGMIEKTDAGLVLKADDGDYALAGAPIADDMVGKKVKATGKVTEADGKKTLEVTAIEEAK